MVTDILLLCERWRDSPLTRSSIARLCGSLISSAVTMCGPSGQNESIPLQKLKTPDFISLRWISRAVMSLKITKPPTYCFSLFRREVLPAFFRTIASSSS